MTTKRWMAVLLLLATTTIATVGAQPRDPYGDYNEDYNDHDDYYSKDDQDYYGRGGIDNNGDEDNLYQDYAARQQQDEAPMGARGGPGWMKLAVTGALGWFAGAKYHSGRVLTKAKQKFQKEQKQLYSQYYNDVYKLTEQTQELQYMIEQYQDALKQTKQDHELEALQRDYDEFKQPDIDGDDRISRAEFNMYVQNYLSHYPGLTEKDYPKFEDFDHDGDGFVSFQEYAQQMALQAQQAEVDALSGGGSSDKAQAYQDIAGNKQQQQQQPPKQATGSFESAYQQYL